MILGSGAVPVTSTSDFAPALCKEFLDFQATIYCGFTLKRVRDMTRTYSQIHRMDKYSEYNHLASLGKWLSVRLRAKRFWVRAQFPSLKLQILHLLESKEVLDYQPTIECEFTLKRVRDMTRTKSTVQISTKNTTQLFGQFGLMVECLFRS